MRPAPTLPRILFPRPAIDKAPRLADFVTPRPSLSSEEVQETEIPIGRVRSIDLWNSFLAGLSGDVKLPSFPVWLDEVDAAYPFEEKTPYATPPSKLAEQLGLKNGKRPRRKEVLQAVPPYARQEGRSVSVMETAVHPPKSQLV